MVILDALRGKTWTKYFWYFMAIHLLNLSVDAPDLTPSYIAEDLMINDQESVMELIAETVLGFEDAFPEYDDNDGNEIREKTGKLSLICPVCLNETVLLHKSPMVSKYGDYTFAYVPPAPLAYLSPPPEC